MADLQNLKNELLDELIKITDETGVDPPLYLLAYIKISYSFATLQ